MVPHKMVYYVPVWLLENDSGRAEFSVKTDKKAANTLAKKLGLLFIPDKLPAGNVCMADNYDLRPEFMQIITSMHLMNYLYSVLHTNEFTQIRAESLVVDFTQIPMPKNTESFWNLVQTGEHLRQLHILNTVEKNELLTPALSGENPVIDSSKLRYEPETSRIWVNDRIYFKDIPDCVWQFKFGGQNPLKKWLLNRHNQILDKEKVRTFGKKIVAIAETLNLQNTINTLF